MTNTEKTAMHELELQVKVLRAEIEGWREAMQEKDVEIASLRGRLKTAEEALRELRACHADGGFVQPYPEVLERADAALKRKGE